MAWRAILVGDDAVSARQTIREIAKDISHYEMGKRGLLAEGAAGIAMFFAYAARAGLVPDELSDLYLSQALSIVERVAAPPTLYGGFVGVAWVAEHLATMSVLDARSGDGDSTEMNEEDTHEEDEEIDEALLGYISRSPWRDHYDLLYGLTGLGVYALARRPRPIAEALLQAIVSRLEELAEPCACGVTLPTPAALLVEERRPRFPMGLYDLGVAHGVPAVIGMLGSVGGVRAQRLRQDLTKWLRSVQSLARDGSLYPWSLDRRGSPTVDAGCRAAWCYGDPGIAAALLRGARAAADPSLEALALEIGRTAAVRPMETAGAVDATLCHGAAGLLHIYNRLYQATGDAQFGDLSRRWAARTLAMRGEGVGGFRYVISTVTGEARADPGFLNGAAGIGLALLAAITEIEPSWDAVMLCDIPPIGVEVSV